MRPGTSKCYLAGVRLLDVIQRSASFLAERGVESPRLQVELILAQVLQLPRLRLYLEFERELDDTQLAAAREAIRKRGQRVPLQHILGTTSFCGLEVAVGPEALIPRPETELLAEWAWTWLGRLVRPEGTPAEVLDWGTGTGCLALAISQNAPFARVTAIDVSPQALALARRNANQLGFAPDRVAFVESDGCAALTANQTFDLVVSNPPYIPTDEIPRLDPEVRDHDPMQALDGGGDGLTFYRRLVDELRPRLRPGGRFAMEFGDGQAPAIVALLDSQGWQVEQVHRDFQGRDRFLVAIPSQVTPVTPPHPYRPPR
ncbi:MAG: peptide chain release factor N(5)-glutamine methyltransferase [Verrucomicrobiales bacterium]|nr:peptide chain release factor N(5)-glutamine methyltransferase [Verrucomicrobiales bacterium]